MTEDLLREDAAIAAELVTTWGPFFGRFGRLRDVQRQAIPQVLSGHDLLLVAPTASGKTEADRGSS
jgi:ATP-dependent Lhr-like helicase